MKFLAFLTPPPAICHGCSTRNIFWEQKFVLVNITSCGRCDVRKHRDINNGEQYIILEVYYNIDCLKKSKVTSSESKYHMGIPGKGMTTSLYISTKGSNKKQKARFPLLALLSRVSGGFSRSFRSHLIQDTRVKGFIMNQLRISYY